MWETCAAALAAAYGKKSVNPDRRIAASGSAEVIEKDRRSAWNMAEWRSHVFLHSVGGSAYVVCDAGADRDRGEDEGAMYARD